MATSTPLLPSDRRADDPAPAPRAAPGRFRLPFSVVAAITLTTALYVVPVLNTWGCPVWTAYFSSCYLLIVGHFIAMECFAQFPHRRGAALRAWRIFAVLAAGIFPASLFKFYFM